MMIDQPVLLETGSERPMERFVRSLSRVLVFVCLLGISLPGAVAGQEGNAPPSDPPVVRPEIVFEAGAVSVEGLTPGGEAVLFGVARRALGYHQRVERVEEVLVADAEGVARLEMPEGVPVTAVWALVDLTTGELAAGPSPGFSRSVRPFPTAGLRGRGGVPGRLSAALEGAQILYVRPGEGAWGTALLDGGVYDQDGADDGAFEVSLADLVAVGTSGTAVPPAEVAAGDLVVVVDSTDLDLFVLRVTPDALR